MARTMKVDLPPFTLVGATTRPGLLSQPLHGRFGITLRLDFYDVDALAQIIDRSARILSIRITPEAAREIGVAQPRHAAHRQPAAAPAAGLRRGRAARTRSISRPRAARSRASRSTSTASTSSTGGSSRRSSRSSAAARSGVGAIAASLGEDRGTLEDLYEPYLLQAGFLQRTPRGRVASPAAYRHLGIAALRERDGELF